MEAMEGIVREINSGSSGRDSEGDKQDQRGASSATDCVSKSASVDKRQKTNFE